MLSHFTFDPARYLNEIPSEQIVIRCVHGGEPVPKQRPRFSPRNSRVYTPGSTRDHETALAVIARVQLGPCEADSVWAFGIRAIFYVQTFQRKDVDNMLKVVLDGMNKIVFADDSQVKELMGWSVIDHEHPRTEFVVYRLYEIDREEGFCVQCGKSFRRYKSWKNRLHCSRGCYELRERKAQTVACVQCERKYVVDLARYLKNTTGRFVCSKACASVIARIDLTCGQCGVEFCRPRSLVSPGDSYCSKACYVMSRVGKPFTYDERSAASKKGWAAKKARAAELA